MTRAVRRPDPPPLETDDVRTVSVITSAWAAALVVLAVLRVTDVTRVEDWWLVMCGYGLLLGLGGIWLGRRRHAAIERDKVRGIPRRD